MRKVRHVGERKCPAPSSRMTSAKYGLKRSGSSASSKSKRSNSRSTSRSAIFRTPHHYLSTGAQVALLNLLTEFILRRNVPQLATASAPRSKGIGQKQYAAVVSFCDVRSRLQVSMARPPVTFRQRQPHGNSCKPLRPPPPAVLGGIR